MKTISNKIIRKLCPCYDPSEVVKDENEELPVKEWVVKYRDLVKDKSDIIWLLCNKLYMSSKDMRLFAVWCAKEALKLVKSPDQRSIEACNVVERYAKGEATKEELEDAARAASNAADYWDAQAASNDSDTSDIPAALAASAARNVSAAWNTWASSASWTTLTTWGASASWAARNAATAWTASAGWIAAKTATKDVEKNAAAAEAAAKDAQIDHLMTYF